MREEAVRNAVDAAEEFLDIAREALHQPREKFHWEVGGTKLTGALRRSSMELTRKLAEMRRP